MQKIFFFWRNLSKIISNNFASIWLYAQFNYIINENGKYHGVMSYIHAKWTEFQSYGLNTSLLEYHLH